MKQIRNFCSTLVFFIAITFVTGIVYPASSVLLSQLIFKAKASGQVQKIDGHSVGLKNLGEDFSKEQTHLFQARESAYKFPISGGSNLAPTNPEQKKKIKERKVHLAKLYGVGENKLPPDSYTESASGLDPDISTAYAYIQVPLLARSNNISERDLEQLVAYTSSNGKTVNVLALNIGLLKIEKTKRG